MSGFHMVGDITIGMYSLFGLFVLAVEHRLRTAGVWRWIGATWHAARAWAERRALRCFDPAPIGEPAFQQMAAVAEPTPARRPRPRRRAKP